jgi:ABC-type multidrug transport system permease subunit
VTKYINPLAITLESSVDKKKVEDENEEAKSKAKDLPLSFYFFPGTLLMALFFMAEGLSGDLWAERDRGTLRRVSMTPHSMAAFLGGKFVANAIVILLVSLVLLVIGCLYFNRPLSVLPLGLFWMTISGLALLSVLSLLQMLATSQRAAALFTNSLMFPLLMIGGSFFPFEVMPLWMAAIGRLTPNGWILVQLKSIMLQETEIGSFAVATAALVGVFVVFFGSCVVRLSAVRARG